MVAEYGSNSAILNLLLKTYGDNCELTGSALVPVSTKDSNLMMIGIILTIRRAYTGAYTTSMLTITDEIKECMSEEQLECWSKPKNQLQEVCISLITIFEVEGLITVLEEEEE